MKLLVVTVTYKTEEKELDLFIQSFFRFNDLGDEAKLVIVDNSPSNYKIVRNLVQQSYKDIVAYIPNPANPGFGASNNLGFLYQDSDYVLFVNNDVEFTESIFLKIISKMKSDNSIGCIGIHQLGGAPSFFVKMTASQQLQTKKFDDKIHFISGAFMFFRSDVFKKIGMFDERIFMYLEEFDVSERILNSGYKTVYYDSVSFWHKVKNRKIQNEKMWQIGTESFCYVCKKYNLNPYSLSLSNRRLVLLLLYFILHFNIKEFLKILRIIKMRKRIIERSFPLKKYL